MSHVSSGSPFTPGATTPGSSPSIVCSHLSFAWPDDTPVFDDLSLTVGPGRTGLVAPNGAGKSTLLALVAGLHRPRSGTITVDGVLGYLPQTLPYRGDLTVADVLGVAPVLAAISAVEAGDVDERHFTVIGNDWDVEQRSRAQLDRLGLIGVELARPLHTLSGGQITALGLAAELLAAPDVLLLDEPTNNLDADARHRLHDVLDDWSGCLVVVSHDRALLDRMDRIAELDDGEIRFFGGGYTAYEEAIDVEQQAAEQRIRTAKQQVKREKREMQQARERADRRASTGSRKAAEAGLPKIVAGELKRKAQVSAAKNDDVHGSRLAQARARLDDAQRSLRDDDTIIVDLPKTSVPAGRTVFHGDGIRVRDLFDPDPAQFDPAQFDSAQFDPGQPGPGHGVGVEVDGEAAGVDVPEPGLDLSIRGPERIALTGPNGSGKSTLLRVISGDVEPEAGTVRRLDGRVAQLTQRLDVLDADRSVAENLALFAPSMPPVDRMNLLARFLFRGDGAQRPVHSLSGGELLRATLVCTLFAEPAPQLLLLDEPTNNLDLVSVGQLESALRSYEGALVVVSHDERFLSSVRPTRHLELRNGALREQ
ncbi:MULTISPECIES: ABC-F family ATP-binding cassette domain-containing protein [Prauserella salsuginis group]|uniref:ABC-F family ATP-binding cassette domain-containing protein n=1 Tax=Prauserella salsuginis TaxID=387889 RepID=A0ABW6G0I6_9PSEU|nr:ATPase components of ABC transporters with duplicated ATPase domains [Prauserella flava]MCR3734588.1 ATPase components of ABC transporters with duplicated ATPase domains [Prauserella salsuginis]